MPNQQKGDGPPAQTPSQSSGNVPVIQSAPPEAKVTGEGDNKADDDKYPCQRSPWNSLEITKIIGEIVLIGIGSVALWVYSGQLCQMIESNRINRDALESVQRAFVTFKQINLDMVGKSVEPGGRAWIFSGLAENSGTTPAIDRISYFTGSNALSGEPSEEEFIGNDKNRPVGEIGPRSQTFLGIKYESDAFVLGNFTFREVPTPEFHRFFNSHNVFFWGWIGYRDVFGNTDPHVTEFCQHLKIISVNDTYSQAKLRFVDCDNHNCTDRHCKDYRTIADMVPK